MLGSISQPDGHSLSHPDPLEDEPPLDPSDEPEEPLEEEGPMEEVDDPVDLAPLEEDEEEDEPEVDSPVDVRVPIGIT